ncbi:hypothetical protein F5B21DRAFT_464004 [Xylaria acuta]|nr:hypothetical protein F5B21DRAFT_464004 [Xylaria acuta]
MSGLSRGAFVTPIERLPPEVKVHVMGYLIDYKSLLHLLLASRLYRDAFQTNESAVAKEIACNVIGPGQFKLAIMAERSRSIDFSDELAIEDYLEKYVCHSEWPLSHYNIRLIARAHQVDKAMWTLSSHVRCQGFEDFHLGCSTLTHTEKQRVRRILYICAIASNLFPLGSRPNIVRLETLYPKLCYRFWSYIPAWDAKRIEHILSSNGILMDDSTAAAMETAVRFPLPSIYSTYGNTASNLSDGSLLQAVFLASGLDAWTGRSDLQTKILCDQIESIIANIGYPGIEIMFTKRLYYEADQAGLLQPLPVSSPFYEQDPGIEDMYYTMDVRIAGKRARTELIRLAGIEPNFLTYHRWALGIMDRARLPRIPSRTELESVPIIDPTEEQ